MKSSDLLVASAFGASLCFDISSAQGNTNTFERLGNVSVALNYVDHQAIDRYIVDERRDPQEFLQQIGNMGQSLLFYNTSSAARLFPDTFSRALYAILYGSTSFNNASASQRLSAENHILKFSDKDLHSLQRQHADFSQFRTMKLQRNGFVSLNWLPRSLPKLRVLNLDGNRITSLDFPVMISLTTLRLAGNPLKEQELKKAPWGNMPNLKMLHLPKSIKKRSRREIEDRIRRSCPNVKIYWKNSK